MLSGAAGVEYCMDLSIFQVRLSVILIGEKNYPPPTEIKQESTGMIISASRRTDIPAFFSNWFMNRVREGYFYSVNPFNSNQITKVSLESPDVDAICFWTKNPRPLIKHLIELENLGLNYYFQFTLNPYGKEFEPGLPSLEKRIATFRALSGQIGQERVVWRYDPVILSNATPVEWHLERADFIASSLSGRTDRLVFSFCDFLRQRGEGKATFIIKEYRHNPRRYYRFTSRERNGETRKRIQSGCRSL